MISPGTKRFAYYCVEPTPETRKVKVQKKSGPSPGILCRKNDFVCSDMSPQIWFTQGRRGPRGSQIHQRFGNILKLERFCVLGHVAAMLVHPRPKIPKRLQICRMSGDPLKLERSCVLGYVATNLVHPKPKMPKRLPNPPEVMGLLEVRTILCTRICCQHP